MRSRFTAFVRGDLDHIEYTHTLDEREKINRPTADSLDSSIEWIGLEIFGATLGGEKDDTGTVDFAASFRQDGKRRVHREMSNFRREAGRWVYVDGEFDPDTRSRQAEKIGRNQPCPCGSGNKFKKCCGA